MISFPKIKYEHWSFWLLYAPMVPIWLYYSLKNGSFTYFCNANPGMKWGGFISYSKFDALRQVPEKYLPKTYMIHQNQDLHPLDLSFPFIAKPDRGERGVGVELIDNKKDLADYLKTQPYPIIIQEYLTEPMEFGVFYVRKPTEKEGHILSITGKEFLEIVGDGIHTFEELLLEKPRATHRLSRLKEKHKRLLNWVLNEGECFIVEPIGNHNRGTKFTDVSHLTTEELRRKFDEISSQLDGIFYGRWDIRSNSIQDFQQGIFKIIEINGSNSEPTHIYDPEHFLRFAYKEILRHLSWQAQIAKENHDLGKPWHNPWKLLQTILAYFIYKK